MPPSIARKDIQGLRALAVSLVVIFHLVPVALPGGYIGVDVFFVISGFLITSHLLREVDRTGNVDLTQFWARRVRRLLPAAVLVLVVSAIVVSLFVPTSLRVQNYAELAFAGLYVVNWNLAANSVDYLGAHNTPSIAQHYWSLSVEEQFYLVWPILIVLALFIARRLAVKNFRAVVGGVLVVVFVASLVFSILETARSQPSAYFVTPTRAWEFALGGLVGMVAMPQLGGTWRRIVSWLAVMMVVVPAFVFNATTPFPGSIALIPVVGTALLLWVGDDDHAWSPQFVSHAGPVQWLGNISYSVYLWHWPLIVVYLMVRDKPPGPAAVLTIAAVTLLLGALSKRFVEDPVRQARGVLATRRTTFAAMAGGMAVVLAVTMIPAWTMIAQAQSVQSAVAQQASDPASCFGAHAITNHCADPYAVTETVNPAVTSEDQFTRTGLSATGACSPGADPTTEVDCILNKGDGPRVLAIGDSHLSHLLTPLAEVARQENWDAQARTRVGCSGFESAPADPNPGIMPCVAWGEKVFADAIADPDLTLVIIGVRASVKDVNLIGSNAREYLAALRAAGKRVVIVTEAPGMPNSWPPQEGAEPVMAPECVEAAGDVYDPCAWSPPTGTDAWLRDAARESGAEVVDLRDILCSADGLCHAVIGGTIVYFDDSHLATTFAMTLSPWLREKIDGAN
ncbi:acyltransferase family protein [Microbacterium sp. ZW T5_56]|uniref:acyltransferase family protein n=1 Tax=Microbacterium sp. ZW T5_56 TaxID=3378081 RepID=UPI003852640C